MAKIKNDKVNLDALIRRQDLESKEDRDAIQSRSDGGIPVSELAIGKLYYELLRKPHFQRETDDWSVDNVVVLIKSFRDGNLIPAIILWRGDGFTFVIDGAHRLSALIAWVNDDYGDRNISQAYLKGDVPKKQKAIAQECRNRVEAEVGSYAKLSQILTSPNPTAEQRRWAANISLSPLQTQTVVGDADMAAKSFLAINQRAVQIDPTERYMIEHRNKPNVIAARALVNSARGHQYWNKFEPLPKTAIEKNARLIYNAIFEPEDAEPGSSIDLQPAGQAQTANGLRIALDLVNLTNDIKGSPEILEADIDGRSTERFIEKTHAVVKYAAGSESSSMSLHPAVYFWGSSGNHQPSIFLAVVAFVQEMVMQSELIEFTIHRARFEEFLVGNGAIGKNILGKHGGWKKSVSPVKKMLRTVFNGLKDGKTEDEIGAELLQPKGVATEEIFSLNETTSWRETKSSLRRKASLDSALRCPICKARMVMNHASDDHIQRRTDNGSNGIENAQLTHKYCNTGFKEYFMQKGLPLPTIDFSL